MITTLDLFAGIGGFALGLEATNFFRTTCFVENEPYCQAVLKYHWPDVPVLGDIRDVRREDLPDPNPGLICGGFPCQPFSHAGKQRAQDDPRHLWPDMLRLIRECRPDWVVGENVTGLINLGLDEVLADLEGEGYATRTFNIPACAVGAPHLRQRLWIVAHSDSESEPDGTFDGNTGQRQLGFGFMADAKKVHGQGSDIQGSQQRQDKGSLGECGTDMANTSSRRQCGAGEGQVEQSGGAEVKRTGQTLADPISPRTGMEEHRGSGQGRESAQSSQPEVLRQEDGTGGTEGIAANSNGSEDWWTVEPNVGRVAHGVPARVAQLRALGNSIVPQIAKEIGNAIKGTY